MKVLLLCMAFATACLAMPVAEEPKVEAPAPVAVETETKAAEIQPDTSVVPVEEKKDEAAVPAATVPEAEPALKSDEVIQPEGKASVEDKPAEIPKVEENTELKSEDKPEIKVAEVANDVSEKATSEASASDAKVVPEKRAAIAEPEPAEDVKPTEVPAIVNEVPKDVVEKSAVPEGTISVDQVKTDSAVSDVYNGEDIIAPREKKIDLPASSSAEAPKEEIKKEESTVQEAKPEEKKVEEPKPESKSAEAVAEPVPVPSPVQSEAVPSDDNARVVRDIVEEKEKVSDEAAVVEAKPAPKSVEKSELQDATNAEATPKVEESPKPEEAAADAAIKTDDAPKPDDGLKTDVKKEEPEAASTDASKKVEPESNDAVVPEAAPAQPQEEPAQKTDSSSEENSDESGESQEKEQKS